MTSPVATASEATVDRRPAAVAIEAAALVGVLALAAILRLSNLPTRGTWDADQGHDMLVLRDLVQFHVVPLLGPPTSIGDFHHGMLYYLLLAPAAAISNVDPTAVTGWIALGGTAAVAVTAWLARAIAGPIAGLVAGLLMAVSASAIDESTFIWNPNLIALSSSVALAAAWHAWQSGRTRWWLVAGAGAIVTMQCHVLGVILTPVVAALLIADVRRRRAAGDGDGVRRLTRAARAWVLLALASYVPLAIHELQTSGSELRAAVAFFTTGGSASVGLPLRLPIVGLRVLGWPLAGLITDAPAAVVVAATLVVVIAIWRGWPTSRGSNESDRSERTAVRWLALGLMWTVMALALGAASLATVVAGLPNDHYHAFADPMVFVLVGIGVAALVAGGRSAGAAAAQQTARTVVATAIVAVIAAWNLGHLPAAVAADGGWPAAQEAAARVLSDVPGAPLHLVSLPAAKSADALAFPLEHVAPGMVVDPPTAATAATAGGGADGTGLTGTPATVVLCDQLFREAIGADCGGPAEDAALSARLGRPIAATSVIDRFEAAPGRWISVYRPTAGS